MSRSIVDLPRAVDFTAHNHVNQRRKGESAEPYINHVIEVAPMLAGATGGRDRELVIAGVLHDTIEDTNTTHEDIERAFGGEVANLVAEVSDDKSLEEGVRKRLQVERAPHKSDRAKMIKLADKTSNLRAIVASPPTSWTPERQRQNFEWAREVAHGCRGVNQRLEIWFDEAYASGQPSA